MRVWYSSGQRPSRGDTKSGTKIERNELLGQRRITEIQMWDQDYLAMEMKALIEFERDGVRAIPGWSGSGSRNENDTTGTRMFTSHQATLRCRRAHP